MTKGFSNLNRFVTTLTSTFNFLTRSLEDLNNHRQRNKQIDRLKREQNW